jgi:DNA-3-methyladenine glycosylase II
MKAADGPAALWNMPQPDEELRPALEELAQRDPDVARAFASCGLPPVRRHEPGFAGLVRIICAQQVSALAARAMLAKLDAAVGALTPEVALTLQEPDWRAAGFSRAKVRYVRALAEDVLAGRIDLAGLEALPDEEATLALTRAQGIGRWSADIYLLFALRRPDVWPVGDLAVRVGAQRLKGWAVRPDEKATMVLGEAWRPFRSAGARLLWHVYRHPGLV